MIILSNDDGKKHIEREELYQFIEAYTYSQGEELIPVGASEAPDFICKRSDGTLIGVELTKIIRDPETKFADKVLFRRDYISGSDALDKIYSALEKKKGLGSKKIVLVLQLFDCPLSDLKHFLDKSLKDDFVSYGFAEIWIADYTGLKAYGDIELFCLYPSEKWGYYERENASRKPYG